MSNARRNALIVYAAIDIVISAVVWILFHSYQIGPPFSNVLSNEGDVLRLTFVPVFWFVFFLFLDEYQDPYRKTRFRTFSRTFWHSILGVFVLYLLNILDRQLGVGAIATYFGLQFLCIGLARLIHLTILHDQIQKGRITFNTVLIGSNGRAWELYREMDEQKEFAGYNVIGFVNVNGTTEARLQEKIPHLGNIDDIHQIIHDHQVEEALVALEDDEYSKLRKMLDVLFDFSGRLTIRIIPDLYDILLGKVKLNYVYGAILIEVEREIIPRWQRMIKRIFDIVASILVFILFWWLYLYIAIRVRISSQGPIFYKQERIGLGGKPFHIYKFRSMKVDAE